MKKMILCLILLALVGCRNQYLNLTGNFPVINNHQLIELIKAKTKNDKKQNYLIKTIVWNKNCECGLIDFTSIKKHSYNYSPVLIDSKNVYWLRDNIDPNKLINDYDIIKHNFIENNKTFLTFDEIQLINTRLEKGVVHFGHTLMHSDLDLIRDSLLLNKYLLPSDTTLKVYYNKSEAK